VNGVPEATRTAIVAARAGAGAAIRKCRDSGAFRFATAAFADCADSPELAAERAERLLADSGWAGALLTPLVEALAADPLFEPPIKVHRDALRIGAVLFDCPAVSIAASVTSASAMAALPPPRTIVFTGRIAVTRTVRSGGGRLRRWCADAMAPAFHAADAAPCSTLEPAPLKDGMIHRTDGRCQAQLICDAGTDVVTLVATIRAGAAPLMREYDIDSGALLRVADADDRPSRTKMLLRFLRVAGRTDASACFDDATHASEFHLRWAAMREWLALDAVAATDRLAEMACDDPHAEVRTVAMHMLPIVESRLAAARCLA
jgi:hypothetical protein